MAYKLIITEKAEHDLDGILTYILQELCNETAAAALLEAIEKSYGMLEIHPHMYPMCRQLLLNTRGYRKLIVNGYILIMRIDEEMRTVYIERVFSRLEDYAEKL